MHTQNEMTAQTPANANSQYTYKYGQQLEVRVVVKEGEGEVHRNRVAYYIVDAEAKRDDGTDASKRKLEVTVEVRS